MRNVSTKKIKNKIINKIYKILNLKSGAKVNGGIILTQSKNIRETSDLKFNNFL